ncbi:uncharacterized protein LOC126797454 [Argentina anserina]|uniref:uncharacterized protein LOC126797454 n=1 Tax=Argentina anserina TaxID=57926 RepID=UPI0021765D82|nr:uncharacterized protein LOC126797454 [Potentilla anserina]
MDKDWVFLARESDGYISGVRAFISRSQSISPIPGKIFCPCKECKNRWRQSLKNVEDHIRCLGMWNDYVNVPWTSHGEELPILNEDATPPSSPQEVVPDHGMADMLQDAFGFHDHMEEDSGGHQDSTPSIDALKFYKLLDAADTDLFLGARIKKLEFLVRLYKIKCLHSMSDVAFSKILDVLRDTFPTSTTLPTSFYKTKKIMKDIGLSYTKIDACPNDCMLYWKDRINDDSCDICHTSRWKKKKRGNVDDGKPKARKVLRYFPLAPRLQRLYVSRHTAESMSWHSTLRTKDGVFRHPADAPAWAHLDEKYPDFGNECRNVRLGLASDGFNPFGMMNSSRSTWPVVMSVYNLPPWLCMKQPYMFLSLLIPGPKGPGKSIDVYLQPLVEELKMLWNQGVETYDAFKKETFTMRAAVLWTINDFPAYAMLSGYSTSGKKACPVCCEDTVSERLKKCKKQCYLGHRRWLDAGHRYRGWKNNFNGDVERRYAPRRKTGFEVLRATHGLTFQFGNQKKKKTRRKRKRPSEGPPEKDFGNWKKKSILFELPYWEHNLLPHCIDPMHTEKNFFDNLFGTLLGVEGKNKDSKNARDDMVDLDVKHDLHPVKEGDKIRYPAGSFNLLKEEKKMIYEVMADYRPPDGWSSNISSCVRLEERKLIGLKSHDCHILMQYILPIAIRRPIKCKKLITVLLQLSGFFRQLCTKVGSKAFFEELSRKIALTLCDLESIMPPSFFDIMEHLPIHLAEEAAIGDPVQYRWMYPIERYLHTLKEYMRNKAHPEASIAEGYIIDECLSFCTMYLSGDTESERIRQSRNGDDPHNIVRSGLPLFVTKGRALEYGKKFTLTDEQKHRAHTHVLLNCPEIDHHLKEHVDIEKRRRGRRCSIQEAERLANLSFSNYFKSKIRENIDEGDVTTDPDIRALAEGPSNVAKRYKKYVINGCRFHVKSVDTGSTYQNSGIYVKAESNCYATANDRQPRNEMLDYYGVLTDIIELDYHNGRRVLLFEGDWIDSRATNRGLKKDEFGFILVNFSYLLPPADTFIFASQAEQVFYIKDLIEPHWEVVVKAKPRDFFDMGADLDPEPYAPQQLADGVNAEDNGMISRFDISGVNLD